MTGLAAVMIVAMGIAGFFGGLLLILVLEILATEAWIVGVILLIGAAGFVLWETLTERVFRRIFTRASGAGVTEADRAQERRSSAQGRYAAALGIALAFLASRFWAADDILRAF